MKMGRYEDEPCMHGLMRPTHSKLLYVKVLSACFEVWRSFNRGFIPSGEYDVFRGALPSLSIETVFRKLVCLFIGSSWSRTARNSTKKRFSDLRKAIVFPIGNTHGNNSGKQRLQHEQWQQLRSVSRREGREALENSRNKK